MAGIDSATLKTATEAPKKVQGDELTAEQHPLPDQLEADRYLKSNNALTKKKKGLNITRLKPPGTV